MPLVGEKEDNKTSFLAIWGLSQLLFPRVGETSRGNMNRGNRTESL